MEIKPIFDQTILPKYACKDFKGNIFIITVRSFHGTFNPRMLSRVCQSRVK